MSASSTEFPGLEEFCHQIVPGTDVKSLSDSVRRNLAVFHADFRCALDQVFPDNADPRSSATTETARRHLEEISDAVAWTLKGQELRN